MYFETEAIVLKANRGNNNSVFLTLFSLSGGKMDAVANGAKSSKSQLAVCSKPFVQGHFILNTKTKPIQVHSCDLINSHYNLSSDLLTLATAQYIIELCNLSTVPGVSDRRHYNLIVECLDLLLSVKELETLSLFRMLYLIKLAQLTGHAPELSSSCSNCHSHTQDLLFSISSGGFLCKLCAVPSERLYKLDNVQINLIKFIQEAPVKTVLNTKIHLGLIKRLITLYETYIFYHLNIKELYSKNFIDTL